MKEWVARDSLCRRYVGVVWVVLRVLQTSTDSIYITTETRVVLEDLLWFT